MHCSPRRFLITISLGLLLVSSQAISQNQPSSQSNPTSASTNKAQQPQAKVNCTSNGTYVNNKGESVTRPENCSGPPAGATAQCRDGSYSFSRSRSGTCSHHGGVGKWL